MLFAFPIAPFLFILAGIITFLLGFPAFRKMTVGRLQEKDLLPIIYLKKGEEEILKSAGPNISLMIIGAILFMLGIIILFNS